MEDTDLRALAAKAATGDLKAAEELICAVHDHLFALLHLLGIPASDLEDVGQDVALQMYRSLPSYDPMRPFMPWLKSIALHVRANFWRTRRRREKKLDTFRDYLTEQVEQDPRCEDYLDVQKSRLAQCVQRLQERLRNVVTLRYQNEMNSQRIGEQLGLKAQTVRKLLSRARELLRKCVSSLQAEAT
jgi:RNA polymerase sigma-70 factor (ECF subfamily)